MSLVTVNEQIKCSCNFDVCLQRNDLAEKGVDVSSVIISLDVVFAMNIRVK